MYCDNSEAGMTLDLAWNLYRYFGLIRGPGMLTDTDINIEDVHVDIEQFWGIRAS
jgi:hypothetical protein